MTVMPARSVARSLGEAFVMVASSIRVSEYPIMINREISNIVRLFHLHDGLDRMGLPEMKGSTQSENSTGSSNFVNIITSPIANQGF